MLMSDSVTDEVCVTDHIQRIPLSLGAEQWAERALDLQVAHQRSDSVEQIIPRRYDLKTYAAWLLEFYQKRK